MRPYFARHDSLKAGQAIFGASLVVDALSQTNLSDSLPRGVHEGHAEHTRSSRTLHHEATTDARLWLIHIHQDEWLSRQGVTALGRALSRAPPPSPDDLFMPQQPGSLRRE